MSSRQDGPEVVVVERKSIGLGQFQPGDQLTIYLDTRPVLVALIKDPLEGQAIVRPAVRGQGGAGHRDARSTLGTRPYQEGARSHTSKEEDPEITWGKLTFGHELVLRNEDAVFGTEGNILYTGQRLTSVSGPQVQQMVG